MGSCVADEVCATDTCGGRGACAVVDGRTECTCDDGYAGPACESCAAGYHDDGLGGCTTDPCLPNPCTTIANRTVCSVDAGGLAACSCEGGYHDDGTGGCTTDPCLPDPCAAMGMACRDTGGTAECYTPTCDDSNQPTDDSYESGGCVFSPRADGTVCSTTLCVADQACMGGSCVGGAAVTCDDERPCTADSCDPLLGCQYLNDDAIVPDDGLDCTEDVCSGGVASHAPQDTRCDDALYCTGVETCEPIDPSADGRGCVVRDVPQPPGPSSTCVSYVCDEASETFDAVVAPAGTSCSDGLACTSSDGCDGAGACRGTVTGDCSSGGTCAAMTSWGTGEVELAPARVVGALLHGGATTFPEANYYSADVDVFLRSQDTGVYHFLESVNFSGSSSGTGYPVYSANDTDDRVIDLPVMPGVYDVLYVRGPSVTSEASWSHDADETYAYGHVV
ncbi:MAG: hypothetical protein GWO04_44530, partial [Actinobacteria bacterium]|nr:hypothetical protein [Actinomycetota bacterium]NIW33025.1 hypothetical protein [Actinomycetota bacterium]